MVPAKLRSSLLILFGLAFAGVAHARRPPALVEAQRAASEAFASCPESHLPEAAGYRDVHARARAASTAPRAALAARPAELRKVGSRLVLVCDGATIHQGSGYRDFPARLRTHEPKLHVARAP